MGNEVIKKTFEKKGFIEGMNQLNFLSIVIFRQYFIHSAIARSTSSS